MNFSRATSHFLFTKVFLIFRCLITGKYLLLAKLFLFSISKLLIFHGITFLPITCRILEIIKSGLLQRWQRSNWPRGNGCDTSLSRFTISHKATGFSDTSGAYISLTVGLAVSTVTFLVEVTLKGFQNLSIILSIIEKMNKLLLTN